MAHDKIAPVAAKLDQAGDNQFDMGPATALAEHNLLTPTVPREYGGRGLDYFSTALVLEELGAACAGVAAVVAANIHAASPIILAGTAKQKEKYLAPLASREPKLASFALTEPFPLPWPSWPLKLKPRDYWYGKPVGLSTTISIIPWLLRWLRSPEARWLKK